MQRRHHLRLAVSTFPYRGDDQQGGVRLQKHRFDVVEVALRGGAHRFLHLQHGSHLANHLALEESEGLEGNGERKLGQRLVDRHQMFVHQHELVHFHVRSVRHRRVVQVEILHLGRHLAALQAFRERNHEQVQHRNPVVDDLGRLAGFVRLERREGEQRTSSVELLERRLYCSATVTFGL